MFRPRHTAGTAGRMPRARPARLRVADPIVEYPNPSIERAGVTVNAPDFDGPGEARGTANVGGRIYRGAEIEALYGKLVFADWSRDFAEPSGQLFVAHPSERYQNAWPFVRLLQMDRRITSLGQDAAGEIYVLTNETFGPYGETGEVYRLVAQSATQAE